MSSVFQDYYQPAEGTIAGFGGMDLPTNDPTLSKSGWSIEQVRRFLLNESGTNFPTLERIEEIEELILQHINDLDNPHGVSVDAISQDVIKKILAEFVAGTPPVSSPFFGYDAGCPVPFGVAYPATYTTRNFYRMLDGGRLINADSEENSIGVDAVNGRSGLPLFSSFTNLIASTWPTSASVPVNTRLTQVNNDVFSYPFDFYRVDETNATGDFGISMGAALAASNVYTFSAFLQPLFIDGYFVVRQPGNDQAVMIVNVETGDFVLGSNSIRGDVVRYPNGVMRVSYSFVAQTTGINRVQVLHRQTTGAEPARVGEQGVALFLMGAPLIAAAPIGTPVPVDASAAATATALTPDLASLNVPANIPRVMVSLQLDIREQLPALTLQDNVLFQMGNLSLVRDVTKVYLKLAGTTLFEANLSAGLNRFAVSYGPDKIAFKTDTTARQNVTGSYGPLATGGTVVGPCAGHLRQFLLYPEQDQAQCLEFLTNG